jgi:hypothetical protein
MELIQIRTEDDREEGAKGHYYNYEFGFMDEIQNDTRRHASVEFNGDYSRYTDSFEDDDSDNRPDEDCYGDDRGRLYVLKTEINYITTLEDE